MHRIHNEPRIKNAPETSGRTLHWAGRYDIMSVLLGMGVNSSNSRMVVELAQIKPGDSVLDVACGTGNLTLTAKAYAGPQGDVHGIDASPEMIEVARRKTARSKYKVLFDLGLIEKLDFPDGTFDKVISRLAIHHLPDDLKWRAFAEVLRVLKPGGLFFIADFQPPRNPVMNHISSLFVGGHMMAIDTAGYVPMLKETGFVEVTTGRTRSSMLAYASGRKPA